MKTSDVYLAKTNDAYQAACEALDALGFGVIGLRDCPQITIGESCSDTDEAFKELGYTQLAEEFPNVQLEDIRLAEMVWKPVAKPYHTSEMPFNASVFKHDYIINIAKMKTHSLAGVTLCMKNIFGFIPTRKQKLMYHPFIRKAILDMNQIVPSHFCMVDGVWGNEFDEIQSTPKHTGAVIAGENLLAVDIIAAEIMGINLNDIDTYRMAFELWGDPEVNLLSDMIDEVRTSYRRGCLFSTRIRYIKEAVASLAYRAVNRH
jgi:uncharacterized protein (DUF362 family)